jgi:hypothetical protein
MRACLLAFAIVLAMPASSKAAIIGTFGVNPTSAAGAFSNDPNGPLVGGLFQDQYTFDLVGGPTFVTVASATNTFAIGGVTGPFGIQNFAAAIFLDPDGTIGNGDELKFGPQFATISADGLSQELNGSGLLNAGHYYLQIQGNAGALAGYGGNLSVSGVPGPIAGAGLPGLLAAAFALLGLNRRRNASKRISA